MLIRFKKGDLPGLSGFAVERDSGTDTNMGNGGKSSTALLSIFSLS